MTHFEDVKDPLEKVLVTLFNDRSKLILAHSDGGFKGGKLTVWRLERAAGKYLFSDYFKQFGITKDEGFAIMAYFESNTRCGKPYVEELHHAFSQYLDKEHLSM